MNAPDQIQIWEQHAGQPPTCHAFTACPATIADVQRAWISQFSDRWVTLCWTGDDVLASEMEWVGTRIVGSPIATLWVEHPDHLLAAMVPTLLDARWRGPARGMTWDTRDGTRRRVRP
jgi:hypothetical protein